MAADAPPNPGVRMVPDGYQPSPFVVPKDIDGRLRRGRKEMRRFAPHRRLCARFERGDTWWYLTSEDTLSFLPTAPATGRRAGKPNHRVRNTYNFIRPIVEAKVSAATQRVPSYEINPSTTDPEDVEAARLAEKVAIYGYDKWRLRDVTVDVVKTAIAGGGSAYAMPYFDPNVAPFVPVQGEDGIETQVGFGEIKVRTFNGNQVYWEPGVKFADSKWWAAEEALPLDEIREFPGFNGMPLVADASTSDIPTDRPDNDQLAICTYYFERPCPRYSRGRMLYVVNNKVVCPPRDYPVEDAKGEILDEPVLHRLVYTHDPDNDNDLGLVWQLIDFQRTAQDAMCKWVEWKNRCLNPQMTAPINSLISPPDDVPGSVRYYRPQGDGSKPEWERPVEPPQSLERFIDRTVQMMRDVASDVVITPDPNVAARTAQQAIEQSGNRWQSFQGDLAEWHSRLMRHCLILVQRYYTEDRTLAIRGRFGWSNIKGFRGAQLLGQQDVRVFPASLAPLTRDQVQQELAWINANFPGYLTPEVAIAQLHGGTGEKLIESYELDVARVNQVIRAIGDGTAMELPARTEMQPVTDPTTGVQSMQQQEIPGYMPMQVDNIAIWKHVFGDFMKTDDFARLRPDMQEVAQQVWGGINWQENQAQQAALAAQNAQAAQQGLDNAAKPQVKGMPSTPGNAGGAQNPPA